MSKYPHTSFPKNSKVFIIFRDGDSAVDYYLEKKSRFVFFRELGKVALDQIRNISYFRHQPTQQNKSTPNDHDVPTNSNDMV